MNYDVMTITATNTTIPLRFYFGAIHIFNFYEINVKTFQFITMCKGDMNHHEPKNSKNNFTRQS